MKHLCLIAFIFIALFTAPASAKPFAKMSDAELDERARHDLKIYLRYQAAATRIERELEKHKTIFSHESDVELSAFERQKVWELFASVLEYSVGLESLYNFHRDFWNIGYVKDKTRHARHFALGFAAYTRMIALGLNFVDVTIGKAQFERLLDEGSSELGIPKKAFAQLKYNVVHLKDVGRLMALSQYHTFLNTTVYKKQKDRTSLIASASIETHWPRVRDTFAKKNAKLFSKNGIDILTDASQSAWLPVQTEVAEFMGDTKFLRRGRSLIDEALIEQAQKRSQPGDVIVERRNWYLSNVGLPGFWPHAALYLGTPSELAHFFDSDKKTLAQFGMPFSEHLKQTYPKAWASYQTPSHEHEKRIIEAVSEGVVFSTPQHSLAADYVGVLRPKLEKVVIARAIDKAFSYAFRPYDFNFDWYTDESLVCSELVTKSYEKRGNFPGLHFELDSVLGRQTLSPNSLVRQWANALDGGQFDFVYFIDSREQTQKAFFASEADFRNSHKRPKWDISQR